MTDHDRIQRGIEARALLESPLIREGFVKLEEQTVNDMVHDAFDMAKKLHLIERIKVIRDLQQYLKSISTTGRQAELNQPEG